MNLQFTISKVKQMTNSCLKQREKNSEQINNEIRMNISKKWLFIRMILRMLFYICYLMFIDDYFFDVDFYAFFKFSFIYNAIRLI